MPPEFSRLIQFNQKIPYQVPGGQFPNFEVRKLSPRYLVRKSIFQGAHAFRTVGQILEWGKNELKVLGSDESLLNAERILEAVLGLKRSSMYLSQSQIVSEASIRRYRELISRRRERIPLAYIFGECEFWNETLEVSEACLIPRPETEILVENFIRFSGFEKRDFFRFLDLGSGSGAIAIALLREFPNAEAVFADVSHEALKIARKNAKRYDLLARAQFVISDVWSAWDGQRELWEAVVCNPPYLSARDFKGLQAELEFEPRAALDGGEDGFSFYRKFTTQASNFLKKRGRLFLELGFAQAEEVSQLLGQCGAFDGIRTFKDYSKIDRVITAFRKL